MEGQREKTSSRRRQRRNSKNPRSKVVVEPVLIAARRPDSPLLKNGFHNAVASAQPKHSGHFHRGDAAARANGHTSADVVTVTGSSVTGLRSGARLVLAPRGLNDGHSANGHSVGTHGGDLTSTVASNGNAFEDAVMGSDGAELADVGTDRLLSGEAAGGASAEGSSAEANGGTEGQRGEGIRRRAVRIVKVTDPALGPGNREQQLLDRLLRSQGRGAITRAADDLWESKFVAPRLQEVQIQLLEHENEHRARDAVFIMAELLQREPPIKRPVLDQRLRRLEQSAEDPITRDAAGALRRSMRVHHGM